eukprot:scaffold13344_cov215-Alexandrium_tamarense.AAC.5
MGKYQRNIKECATDGTQFKSVYKTLGYWWYSLGIMEEPQDIVEVCYVSCLTVDGRLIRVYQRRSICSLCNKVDVKVWNAIEEVSWPTYCSNL